MIIRHIQKNDLPGAVDVWNEIIREGIAFPQEDELDLKTGYEFFKSQSYTGVAVKDDMIVGVYILHPNNVGRCSHIANASYAVSGKFRGNHIGEKLIRDSIKKAKNLGFVILQFNAVVEANPARRLYERMGFKQLGVIPKGFRMDDGSLVNICPYYIEV